MITTERKENTQYGATTAVVETPVREFVSLSKAQEIREDQQLPTLRSKYEAEIIRSGEIDTLTNSIDVHDLNTILNFGKEPAEIMASTADKVLANYNGTILSQSSKLIDNLLAILEQIDCKEIEKLDEIIAKRQKKSWLDKFRDSLEEILNKAVNKYQGIGKELEEVVAELSKYEEQIKSSNKDIQHMYDASIKNFRNMTAHVLAAEDAVKQIEVYRDNLQSQYETTADPETQFELQNANNALALMNKRAGALQGAEALALQSIPTFKIQEITNMNLAASINEAFIITIPAFKNALVNAVIAKQQSIMAQGLSTLKEMNSEIIRRNAENVGKQLLMSQEIMGTSAVKAEDIEYSMRTIMDAARQYKEREKQMIETSRVESQKIKEIENNYMVAIKDNMAI